MKKVGLLVLIALVSGMSFVEASKSGRAIGTGLAVAGGALAVGSVLNAASKPKEVHHYVHPTTEVKEIRHIDVRPVTEVKEVRYVAPRKVVVERCSDAREVMYEVESMNRRIDSIVREMNSSISALESRVRSLEYENAQLKFRLVDLEKKI